MVLREKMTNSSFAERHGFAVEKQPASREEVPQMVRGEFAHQIEKIGGIGSGLVWILTMVTQGFERSLRTANVLRMTLAMR